MKNVVRILLIISIFNIHYLISNKTFAQMDKTAGEIDAASAAKNYQHGIELMKKENYKGAVEALGDAVYLDSSKANYQFQLGLAHYYLKNYKTTAEVMQYLLKKFYPDERYYILLGESYIELRADKKAYAILLEGIAKFPKSGSIYNELGNIEYSHKNLNIAIQYWENGVMVEPLYPSNYYNLALAYGSTSEKLWAIIYAEIFINLEINTPRTYQIMDRLYDFYHEAIYIKSARNKYAMFTEERTRISNTEFKDTMLLRKNFSMAYNNVAQRSLIEFKDKFDTESLIKFRKKFIDLWYGKNFPINFPNPLFDYQREIISANYFESYNRWLFSKSDPKLFNDWLEINKKKYDEFIKWYYANPLEIYSKDAFTRISTLK